MSELKNALKPLTDALNSQSSNITGVSATLQEIYQLITSIDKRLNVMESLMVQGFRPPSGSRKAIARRGAKKTEEVIEDDNAEDKDNADNAEDKDNADTTEDKDDNAEDKDDNEATETNTENNDQSENNDQNDDEDEKTNVVTKPTKPTKKVTKKTKAKPAAKTKIFNKLIYFKSKFKEDESQFNHIFTPKVRKELDASEKLKGLSGTVAQNARITVYWEYISNDEDGQELLEAAKKEFQETNS